MVYQALQEARESFALAHHVFGAKVIQDRLHTIKGNGRFHSVGSSQRASNPSRRRLVQTWSIDGEDLVFHPTHDTFAWMFRHQ